MSTYLFQTRREFLNTGMKGVGLIVAGGHVPAFLARAAAAVGPGKDSTILVVLQLSGGNDGLNTVIPFADERYYSARPKLAIAADKVTRLSDTLGLNPACRRLQSMYDGGRLMVIQNAGYPNPNRSHFRSMDIWHGGSMDELPRDGWLGRYFDAKCSGAQPQDPAAAEKRSAIGISMGKVMPKAFRNQSNVGIALDDPETFQWNPSGETVALARAQEQLFEKINRPGGPGAVSGLDRMRSGAGRGGMAESGGIVDTYPATLEFLRHTAMNALLSGDHIRGILAKAGEKAAYPDSALGHQLRMIARLIAGGMPTRVYYATQGGYDTHANQPGTHERLLGDVSESLGAFTDHLAECGLSGQVMVMAFSEFGRRVAENASSGTDHGAAAPMFVMGEGLRGGVLGPNPDLGDLVDGDVRHTTDFREVYAALLEGWLGVPGSRVLGPGWKPAAIFPA